MLSGPATLVDPARRDRGTVGQSALHVVNSMVRGTGTVRVVFKGLPISQSRRCIGIPRDGIRGVG